MADDFTVRVVNDAAFRSMMDGLVSDLREMRDPIDATAAAMLPDARAAAPHRSGELAAAHAGAYVGAGRYRITVNTPYAAAVHWGWPAHGIRRQPWVVATWLRNQSRYLDVMADATQTGIDKQAAKT